MSAPRRPTGLPGRRGASGDSGGSGSNGAADASSGAADASGGAADGSGGAADASGGAADASGGAADARERTAWQRWGWLLRWGGTAAGIAYVVHVVDGASLKNAFLHARALTMILALAVVALGLVLGAARWRALMRAYGARTQPPLGEAVRLYFIAIFYNTYLPGGVAGDLLRGVVTRKSFGVPERPARRGRRDAGDGDAGGGDAGDGDAGGGDAGGGDGERGAGDGGRAMAEAEGATAAIAVVMIERALGLLGVMTLVAIGLASVGPQVTDTRALWMWSAIGAGGALGGVLLLPLGRRLARFLPGPLGKIAQRLPVMSRWRDFFLAMSLSLATQLATAVAGWLFLRDLHAGTTLLDALFIVPLAAATVFLPITVGGTGAREAVFIALCAQLLAMPSGDALAASLLLWATSLIAGAFGGLLQLRRARGSGAHAE